MSTSNELLIQQLKDRNWTIQTEKHNSDGSTEVIIKFNGQSENLKNLSDDNTNTITYRAHESEEESDDNSDDDDE